MEMPQSHPDFLTEARIDDLIDGFQRGDSDAVGVVIKHYTRTFTPVLRSKLGRGPFAHKIDDVLQETWLRAYKALAQFDRSRSTFSAWIYRIMANCANDVLRRSRREISTVSYEMIDESK